MSYVGLELHLPARPVLTGLDKERVLVVTEINRPRALRNEHLSARGYTFDNREPEPFPPERKNPGVACREIAGDRPVRSIDVYDLRRGFNFFHPRHDLL